jgi:hypothetical protein
MTPEMRLPVRSGVAPAVFSFGRPERREFDDAFVAVE